MRVLHDPERGLVFSQVPGDYLQLLHQIPLHADSSGLEKGHQRLYPSPIVEPVNDEDDDINMDWRDHVLPDMQAEFHRQLEVLTEDLSKAVRFQDRGGEEEFELVVPMDHLDLWYGAINQARLVMQERYDFPQVDSQETFDEMAESDRLGPYLISRFYTQIQSILLSVMTQGM